MLKHWQTHAEYQQLISEAVASLNLSQLKKLYSMSDSWHKFTSMNLNPVRDFLIPFYSNTGRSALNQPQIMRSFLLMLDRKFSSLLPNGLLNLPAMTFFPSSSVVRLTPSHLPAPTLTLLTACGCAIPALKSPDAKICSLLLKIKKPSSKPWKNKNFPIGIPASLA